MSFKDSWKLEKNRQPNTTKINSVIEKYSHLIPFKKSAADIEESIFKYSKTQDEYSNEVEKILQRIEFLLADSAKVPTPPTMQNLSPEDKNIRKDEYSNEVEKILQRIEFLMADSAKVPAPPTMQNLSPEDKNIRKPSFFWNHPSCKFDKKAFRRVSKLPPPSFAPATPTLSPPASEATLAKDTQEENIVNSEVSENTLPSPVHNMESEPEDDGFVLIPKKNFNTFETMFTLSPERENNVDRMTRSCMSFEETQEPVVPKDDLKVWVEFLEHKLRKITDPKKLCIIKHKIDQVLFEDEIKQCQVDKSEAEVKRFEEVWKTKDFRKIVADKIEEMKDKYDIHCIKSSTELEHDEFIKSKNKAEYLFYIAQLILRLHDSNNSTKNVEKQTCAVKAVTMLVTDLTELATRNPDDN